jgi:uncharacterized protein YggE
MRQRLLTLALFIAAPCVFGQLASDSVTVAVTRNTYLPPDEVVFSVVVQSPANASMDQVLAALRGTGITAADLISASTTPGLPGQWFDVAPRLQWTFRLTSPLTKITSLLSELAALQKGIGQTDPGMSLAFSILGVQASQASQAAVACSREELLGDARNHAQKLADAAGLTLGPLQAVSDSGMSAPSALWSSTGAFLLGAVSFPQSCVLSVKFGLLRYH